VEAGGDTTKSNKDMIQADFLKRKALKEAKAAATAAAEKVRVHI
jgi:hypothetical protein